MARVELALYMPEIDSSLLHMPLAAAAAVAAVVIGTLVAVVTASHADTIAPIADPCPDSRCSDKQRLKAVGPASRYQKGVEKGSHECSSGAPGANLILIVIAAVEMSSKLGQSDSTGTETPARIGIEVLADTGLAMQRTEVRIEASAAP